MRLRRPYKTFFTDFINQYFYRIANIGALQNQKKKLEKSYSQLLFIEDHDMNTNLLDNKRNLSVDRLLKPNEVATLLSVSRSFAYQLLQTGAIPVVRLGRACRVRPQDLETYIQQNLHHQVFSH